MPGDDKIHKVYLKGGAAAVAAALDLETPEAERAKRERDTAEHERLIAEMRALSKQFAAESVPKPANPDKGNVTSLSNAARWRRREDTHE